MTTHVLHARNVNDALPNALWWLKTAGVREESRNGPVVVAPGPVITEYAHPTERVLWSPLRHANPWFHLMEGLWVIAGRSDVAFLAQFNARMREYSDDGTTLHGAYGARLRHHDGEPHPDAYMSIDQITIAVDMLRTDPTTRRCVMQIWSAGRDLEHNQGKDLPCNTQIYLDLRGGALNLTVTCRSNDLWWGAYGANYVHFGMLQEYVAGRLRAPVGVLRQYSHNFHVYPEVVPQWNEPWLFKYLDPYESEEIKPMPIMHDPDAWDADLRCFFQIVDEGDEPAERQFREPFFSDVVVHMLRSWRHHKRGEHDRAELHASHVLADDWRRACLRWLRRAAELRTATEAK